MHEAPSRSQSIAAILLLAFLSAAARCHHGPAESSTHEGGQSTEAGSAAVTVGVPDACAAISATDLAATFGEVGTGTPAGEGSRRICRYENGITVGVSEANQYEPSLALARQSAECSDLTGVGDRAAFCVTGGVVAQLLWVSGSLMYDVTGGQTDEATYTALAGKLAHAH
jgi:hypothetical protein